MRSSISDVYSFILMCTCGLCIMRALMLRVYVCVYVRACIVHRVRQMSLHLPLSLYPMTREEESSNEFLKFLILKQRM